MSTLRSLYGTSCNKRRSLCHLFFMFRNTRQVRSFMFRMKKGCMQRSRYSDSNPCFRSARSAQIQDFFFFFGIGSLSVSTSSITYHNLGIFCQLYLSTIQHFYDHGDENICEESAVTFWQRQSYRQKLEQQQQQQQQQQRQQRQSQYHQQQQ